MAFTNLNENIKEDNSESRLMCSVYGCPNRWAVQMGGKPMCSPHQWADPSNWSDITARIIARNMGKNSSGISNYYEPKDEF